MRSRWLLLAAALLLPSAACVALEVHVAPLAVVGEAGGEAPAVGRPQADLLRELARQGAGNSLTFRSLEQGQAPAGFLEAALLCERQGCSYLLYGYLKRTPAAYSAELKLLDHENGQLAAAFFGSDDLGHYERLIRELAAKVRDWFLTETGLPPPRPAPAPRRNVMELEGWLGYWTPVGGEWDRVLAGIGAAGMAVRLIPAYPLFQLWSRRAWLSLGLEAEYGLGMNEPDYESFFLHSVRLRLPLEAMLEMGAGHEVGLGAGLLVQLDAAAQDRKYAPLFTDTTVAPGLWLALAYRYRLSGRLALGAACCFELTAYSPPLAIFSPRVFVSFRKGVPHE